MAASSFEIIKQGDTKRMFYSGKNFGTGLTIAATPYDPSHVAQTGVSFSEIGSTGMYYYDFDTTSKTLGTWSFIITEGGNKKAFVRIQ